MRVGPLALVLIARASEADDIDSETFRTTPAISGEAFHVEPAEVGGSGDWLVTLVGSFASNPLAVDTSYAGATIAGERPVARRGMLELGGAYAFAQRFEVGARVPLFAQRGDSPDQSTFHVPAADGFALGDIGLHGRARLVERERMTVAGGLHVTLPTSSDGQFVGVDGPTVSALALVALRPMSKLSIALDAGVVMRRLSTYRNDDVDSGAIQISQGSGLTWGAGVGYRATPRVRVTGELFGEIVGAGGMLEPQHPIDALVGARYQLDDGVQFGVAIGRGLTDALGSAALRGVVAIDFVPSRAVTRSVPLETEPAALATPAPAASTAISAASRDRCPLEAEDMDGFEDEDGCADPDNDHDLIPDAQDKCPNEAEVINGVDDNDGCPDVADTSVAAAPSASPVDAADEAFKQGRALMKDKKYARACAAFEASQRLDPQFGTQFNLADCYVEIGKLATAWTMYRELSRADQNAERRKEAAAAAAKVAKRVPKLKLLLPAPAPSGVNVLLNGANANLLVGVETPIDFGSYEITAGAPGYAPWRKTVVVDSEGKITSVNIKLEESK